MWRSTPTVSLALILLGSSAVPVTAQPAQMAADIRTRQVTEPDFESGPYKFVRLGDYLYFGADDGLHGIELWRTDGTAAGTTLVRDICPGQCSGVYFGLGAAAGGRLFFHADDGVHGVEPWVSDGTPEGTRLLLDIHPSGSFPQWFTALGDRMVFTATDPDHGNELWISDGTPGGTELLADLNPGPEGSAPTSLLATAGLVFFNASDADHGREPWVSDGTTAGTILLRDIVPGTTDSVPHEEDFPINPRYAAVAGGKYFFAASENIYEQELWVSDGTPAGTSPLTASFSWIRDLTPLGSEVFFGSSDSATGQQLWRSDGTAPGTQPVTDFPPELDQAGPSGLTAVGSTLFFATWNSTTGQELWKSDGTAAGTTPIIDQLPGPETWSNYAFWWTGGWALDDDRLLFFADDGIHGVEPWISDGTAAGTSLLADIAPQELSSHFGAIGPFSPPARLGADLVFFAWDPERGYEPWATDGSPGGTRLILDLNDQASSMYSYAYLLIADLADAGHEVFFQPRDDTHGVELWATRGTPGTTHLVADIDPDNQYSSGSFPFEFAPLGNLVLFQASQQAWRSDGTTPGTFPVADFASGFTSAGGEVFFSGGYGGFLASDGTEAGTRGVDGVEAGHHPAEHAGTVYFSGRTASAGEELFKLDATHDFAELVADLVPGSASSAPSDLTSIGSSLFFTAATPGEGRELWVSDGTADQTAPLADIRPGPASSFNDLNPRPYIVDLPVIVGSGNHAFFAADDGTHGEELWTSDGMAAGTHLVADLWPGARGAAPQWLTDVAGTLFFTAEDGARGRELWRSDGTAGGTHLVADLAAGEASSIPRFLVDADGVLYFSAYAPEHGVELWRLAADGVPELAADVLPGPDSSSPSYLTVSGRRLIFYASDGVHGFEPWSLVLPSRKLRATLTGSGSAIPGATVFLNVVLTNPTPIDQPDAEGDEFRLTIPAALTPLSVEATSGQAELLAGAPAARASRAGATSASGFQLTWNGALPAGGSVTLTVKARVETTLPGGLVMQGEVFFDTDGDGVNDLSTFTDDPSLPGDEDPSLLFAAQSVLEIPTLSALGLLLLALLLAGLAAHRLRSGREGAGAGRPQPYRSRQSS